VPLVAPTVEIAPLHPPEARRALLPSLGGFDWLVVTSPRTVDLLSEAGAFAGRRPEGLRIAAVGDRTADRLASVGWAADRVPEKAGAEPLLAALLSDVGDEAGSTAATGGRVCFPASAQAGDALPRGLESAGFEVVRIDLYAPRPVPQDPTRWTEWTREGLDALTFTSPSAVDGLTAGLDEPGLLAALRAIPAGVQGPTTGAAARTAGWIDVIEAHPRTFEGLVDALEAWFPAPSDPMPTLDSLRA
jgi:uroporphyrinogen-III synthase